MAGDLPDYYFRVRDGGAVVFRVDTKNRMRRIDMDQIAVCNYRSKDIRPHGDITLSDADIAAINDWMAERRDLMRFREVDDILRTVDHLNQTAQWVHNRATDEQLEDITDTLLMAMHDLRQVLVRKKSLRMARTAEEGTGDAS